MSATSAANDFVYLFQEFALAGFLGAQIEVQCGLLHGVNGTAMDLLQAHKGGGYAEFPQISPCKYAQFEVTDSGLPS